MTTKKKYARKEPGTRSGEVRWVQFPKNLDSAIVSESKAIAERYRRPDGQAKTDIGETIRVMCKDWLEGRGSDHPVTVPPEAVVRLGRPPKKARSRTVSAPSTGGIAGAQKPVGESHEGATTK